MPGGRAQGEGRREEGRSEEGSRRTNEWGTGGDEWRFKMGDEGDA